MPIAGDYSCDSQGNGYTLQFTCNSSCPSSCGITQTQNGQSVPFCGYSTVGNHTQDQLNVYYTIYTNSSTLATYNWCSGCCGSLGLSGGSIAGIVFGCLGAVAVVAVVIYCWMRRSKKGGDSSMTVELDSRR
jgi:hypothetical protein